MGLIQDLGGKLARSLLNLDDLVFGQGLVAEGRSQLGLSGRSVAGSVLAGTNVAARTLHAGVQVGAKTARAAAGALEGFVPGAGAARALAERVDRRAAAEAEAASLRAAHAVEMVSGEVPKSPLNQEPWRSKGVPRGTSWGELAADTAVGSLGSLATLPLAAGLDLITTLSATRAGRRTLDSGLRGAAMLLDLLPGAGSTKLDAGELREAVMAVTASSGDAAARDAAGLAEAALRLSLGDTRKLRQTLHEALETMRLLAGHSELSDLLPAVPISVELRRRARNVAGHAPTALLAALERGPGGEAPAPGPILSALLEDADNLLVFATDYPLALALMATHASLAAGAGMVDANDVEAFVGGSKSARPWSATQLEAYAGRAPDGDRFDPATGVARGVVFVYSTEVLGRERALGRAEELFGVEARQLLEDDVSLDLRVLRTEDRAERHREIRRHVATAEDDDVLLRQCAHCREQLESLEAFSGSIYGYAPKNLERRKDALRTFLSLAGQAQALRDADDPAREEQAKAREKFDQWLTSVA